MKENNGHDFLGQPAGLSALAGTEFWERFSYYGMRAILLYYMYYAVSQGGLGFSKPTALSIMSIYGALVYLSTVPGGYIGDRILGSRRTVLYGGILIMMGHIFLALPFGAWALFASIALITIGTGLLKPNLSGMVGSLYGSDDARRENGFTVFIFSVNLGAFIAPYACGWAQSTFNFHVGFSIAAVGMFFGLLYYYFMGDKTLGKIGLFPNDPLKSNELGKLVFRVILGFLGFIFILFIMYFMRILNIDNFVTFLSIIAAITPIVYFVVILRSNKLTSIERSHVIAYIPLFIGAAIFWGMEEQGSNVLALFAADQVNNNLGLLRIDPSWYQSLNPFFIMIYTPLFVWLWTKLGKNQPTTLQKFSYGLFFAGLSFLLMVLPIMIFGVKNKVSPLWLVGSWAIMEIGEMLISPIGLSVTSQLAPRAFGVQMLSLWSLSDSAGQAINSQIVRFYTPGTEIIYFSVIGIIAIIGGLILLLFIKPVKKLMGNIN